MKCKFSKAWIGLCNNPTDGGDYCDEHKNEICCSCGARATHTCSETMRLVCGAPLCGECEHTTYSNGCNSGGDLPNGMHAHCKKTEQVFIPWFHPDADKKNAETCVKFGIKPYGDSHA